MIIKLIGRSGVFFVTLWIGESIGRTSRNRHPEKTGSRVFFGNSTSTMKHWGWSMATYGHPAAQKRSSRTSNFLRDITSGTRLPGPWLTKRSCVVWWNSSFHSHPCMEYLPTFRWFIGPMLVNIPYMDHLGLKLEMRIIREIIVIRTLSSTRHIRHG